METNHRQIASLLLLSALAACGGGGGGGGSTPVGAPQNLVYSDEDVLVLSGVEVTPILPVVQGQVDQYEVAPALPAGLVLDPMTGIVAGTPTAPLSRRAYSVTASNVSGSTMATLQIEIAAPQRFAIVTGTDDSISTLAVDTAAGKLLRGSLAASGASDAGAERMAPHPSGRFGYLPHSTSNTLTTLSIDPDTGVVEQVGSIAIAAGPHSAVVHSSGNWLLVTCRASGQIQVFALDALTGAPTLSSQIASGTQPSDLVWAGDGTRVFVTHAGADADGFGSTLALFSFDGTTGGLAAVGAPFFLNGARPSALAFDPHDSYVYLALAQFDSVVPVLVTMQGGYTPITPLRPTGLTPVDIAVEARGRYVWTAAAGANEVRSFRISVANHRLSLADTVTVGVGPTALQGDPLGEHVYVASRGSSELFVLDAGPNGSLDVESSIAMRPGAGSITFLNDAAPLAWAPRFVHVANVGSDDVHAFRADEATGALTFSGAAFTDDRPVAVAIDSRQRFALVASEGAHTLQAFAIDATTGELSPTGASLPVNGTPAHVAYEPSGRFAYAVVRDVVAPDDGWLLTFTIHQASGQPTLIEATEAGIASCAVAISPTGEFAYVANRGDGTAGSATISAFRLQLQSGVPVALGFPATAPGIAGIAFNPDGRSVYAVLRGSDALARYTIDPSTGILTVAPPASGSGFEPASLAVDPRGGYVWASYTGLAGPGEIDVLPIQPGGALGLSLQEIVDGTDPISLSLDPSGRFLYAANQGSHDVSVIAVDPATGLLSVRTPMLAGTEPVSIVASGTTR